MYQLSLTEDELIEIESALEAHSSSDPEIRAYISAAFFKVGLALERPWALKKQATQPIK